MHPPYIDGAILDVIKFTDPPKGSVLGSSASLVLSSFSVTSVFKAKLGPALEDVRW